MAHEYIEPTLASRIKFGSLVLAGVLASLAMDQWWHPFMNYVRSLPLCDGLPWLRGILVTFLLAFWLLALLLARTSVLTFRSGQTPLPSAWVWSRTKVHTGRIARLTAAMYALLALTLTAAPVVAAYLLQAHLIFLCLPEACSC